MQPEDVANIVKWVVDTPKHLQIRKVSFNTGNSHIPVRRDRIMKQEQVETDGVQYGSNVTKTWDGKEK